MSSSEIGNPCDSRSDNLIQPKKILKNEFHEKKIISLYNSEKIDHLCLPLQVICHEKRSLISMPSCKPVA